MKTIKRITVLVLISSVLTTFSCTKEGKQGETGLSGPTGPVGPVGPVGPSAKYYDFSVSIPTSTTWASYSLSNTNYTNGDAVIVYWKEFSNNWLIQTPYIYRPNSTSVGANIYAEITSVSLFINTTRADGSNGSPWSSTANLDFRAVVIKASAKLANPNIDYSNYYEVKGAFNLKD